MYEHIICTLDASLCYPKSPFFFVTGFGSHANLLGIYLLEEHSDSFCPPKDPDCDDPRPGGPPDAAICQKMPDACSATKPE